MQRKCCPQQCQTMLDSSRNRYCEQEVNVSSRLRSSQQKLCRVNKSSLTDSPSSTEPLFLAEARAFRADQESLYVFPPEDVSDGYKHIITTGCFCYWKEWKACVLHWNDAFTVNNHGGRVWWLRHKCQDSHRWQHGARPEKASKQRDLKNRMEPCDVDFPPSKAERWLTDRASREAKPVWVCSVLRLAGAAWGGCGVENDDVGCSPLWL